MVNIKFESEAQFSWGADLQRWTDGTEFFQEFPQIWLRQHSKDCVAAQEPEVHCDAASERIPEQYKIKDHCRNCTKVGWDDIDSSDSNNNS